jgi:hypothetical protein
MSMNEFDLMPENVSDVEAIGTLADESDEQSEDSDE